MSRRASPPPADAVRKAPAPAADPTASEWRIERMVPGGDGMARLADGRVGFASGAFPGDRIAVTRETRHASWVRADEWLMVEPSADRVDPACPVADACGGCEWMRLARPAQLLAKSSLVRQALGRTGGLRELPLEMSVTSPGPDLGYRNRLRLHVERDGRVGLYARGSHTLVEIPGCAVSDPAIGRALVRVRELAGSTLGRWSELEIRTAPLGAPVSLWLLPRDERPPSAVERAMLEALSREHAVVEAGGVCDQRWPLPGGVEIGVPPGGFVQVNWAVNVALVEALLAGVSARGISTFVELYAGAGNFTLPLLKQGLSGVAIERSGPSIKAARRAARAQGLADDTFIAGDAPKELPRRARQQPDLVLLDPPRAGARDALGALLAVRPRFIAFCACDPVTLARDVKRLAGDYALDSVEVFDMFPHTHHVETLLWLRQRGG